MSGATARKSAEYRRNRAIIKARGGPCARCGREVEYDAPRYIVVNGVRTENLWAFNAGTSSRWLGGTEELANLQPEHVLCSRRACDRLGPALRFGARPADLPTWKTRRFSRGLGA